MGDTGASTMEKTEHLKEMLEIQVSEVEFLGSMYCNPGEFTLDDEDSIVQIQEFLDGNVDYEFLSARIGLTINLEIEAENGEKGQMELVCQLPHEYPAVQPNVFIRSKQLSRTSQQQLREDIASFIDTLDLGETMIGSIVQFLQDNARSYLDQESTDGASVKQSKNAQKEDTTFTRIWIYSHHIYSKSKRRDIINWASELELVGFSMPGKPGVICVEGYSRNVEEYWQRLRNLNWKRLQIKEKEDIPIENDDKKVLHKFDVFEEKEFNCHGDRNYHMDLGLLRTFMEEHNCGHMFHIYFGVGNE